MTDLLEQRLTRAGRQWQAAQPAPPSVPLDRLDEHLPRRVPWRPALAAAAAVVVAAGVGFAVTRGPDGSTTPLGTSTSPPTGSPSIPADVVPWAPLPAGHPRIGHRVHGHLVTPYDHLVAAGEISGTYHPGDVLRFVVYLQSDRDIRLSPCPDYTIAFGAKTFRTWRLNCADVPHWKGHTTATQSGPTGRMRVRYAHPYLPAGTKVSFQMQITVPPGAGQQKVLWTLDGPQAAPGFYGLVQVR